MRKKDSEYALPTYPIPNDFRFLPVKVDTGVSFPLGWSDIARVDGSAFSVVSSTWYEMDQVSAYVVIKRTRKITLVTNSDMSEVG
jgi:hypothetical protein